MCGIAGFWSAPDTAGVMENRLDAMAAAIAHRGPDDRGRWADPAAGVGLAHLRLSILDLSPAGHQPMTSASGRFVIVYNGEIYNFRQLRRDLEEAGAAPSWRGHSDTEILLAAIEHWGVAEALTRLIGMFAFALWDRHERTLTLARDRAGEKPLYYGLVGGVFLFGSELKALKAHPAFDATVDRNALSLFLRHNYIPAPHSIWQGIAKLPPAHFAIVEAVGARVSAPRCYWDIAAIARSGAAAPKRDTPELIDELDALLRDAVGQMMVADVPLGAFLSGGVDSSTIVALMQAQSSRPVRSFSIGFEDAEFDESPHARAVAAHLGTDHTDLIVTAADALAVVPALPTIWDEPFADSSQIPTYLLSRMTRNSVTVSLSGDGGDELFGGYTRYFTAMQLWGYARVLPPPMRRMVAAVARSSSAAAGLKAAGSWLPRSMRHRGLADRLPKIARLMEAQSPDAVYRRLVSHFDEPDLVVLGAKEPETALYRAEPRFADFRNRMMYLDTVTYLPDDILVKVDRASMAVALESRVPFLDHRVIELAWSLPMSAKISGHRGKRILRDVLDRYVPRSLIERPKMGFGVPLDAWLRGPLREWAEALLDSKRLENEGFLDAKRVRELWTRHLDGGRHHYLLWDILMFQGWLEAHGAR